MSEQMFDVLIIGSGFAGVHAAWPLVEAGYRVGMIDGGKVSHDTEDSLDRRSFEEVRLGDEQQYRRFLGETFSGIMSPSGDKSHAAAMMSGKRRHVSEDTQRLLPIEASSLLVRQTLAVGGFGDVWGSACDVFNNEECQEAGLVSADVLKPHYQAVIDHIGVSGESREYRLQPPTRLDDNARYLWDRAQSFGDHRFTDRVELRRSMLALLSEPLHDRQPTTYTDMDFWDDTSTAIYRPRYTLDQLKRRAAFIHVPGFVVRSVQEEDWGVLVIGESVRDGSRCEWRARSVVVAAGALNTVRLLLASRSLFDQPVSIMTKDHCIVPSLLLHQLGKRTDPRRQSLCQLVLTSQQSPDAHVRGYAQLYSYKALLLYKLMPFIPLPAPQALRILSSIADAFVLADMRFSSYTSGVRVGCQLTGDPERPTLQFLGQTFVGDEREKKVIAATLRRKMRSLGLLPLTTVWEKQGNTSHYAGGISLQGDHPLTADIDGCLGGGKRIFAADASLWQGLPAKPLTLTIMANARRIGLALSKTLKQL